jgi:predicted metalloprotease with PDZ domain
MIFRTLVLAFALIATPAAAQVDPAEITLQVDATDVARGVFRVRERIPVRPGRVTLLYPQWLPGNHAPRGQIDKVAGLTISAGAEALRWRRDPTNVYAFHVEAPAGAEALDIAFQYVSPTQTAQGRVVTTPAMLNLQWNSVLLYPAGQRADAIRVAASVTLPQGWRYATAIRATASNGDTHSFGAVDLATLVDSPMFAGRHFRQIDLDPGARVPFKLNLVAERPDQLAATDAQIALHRNLVRETYRVYGPGRFDHYDFLLALSDTLGGIGLEHLRSSENNAGANYFTEWEAAMPGRSLLPHELTHSWNGKYRRPADLATPDYDTPMQTSMLWVYEGQTQYYGHVLAARSGLWTRDDALGALAQTAATYEHRVGRAWRPLADTVNEPTISARRPEPWRSWQRPEDYYSEGALIWLDADTLIRERSGGRRSLDDFTRAFFRSGAPALTISTYTFEDVVRALNGVVPYDWAAFLRARVDAVGGKAPLDGLARGGWRLVYGEERTAYQKADEKRSKTASFLFSLGFTVGEGDRLTEVLWDSPAFNEALTVGVEIRAVNGMSYDAEGLRRAITAAKETGTPVELVVKNGDRWRTIAFSYRGGLRYPRLERIPGTADRLSAIYRPQA